LTTSWLPENRNLPEIWV